MRDALLAAALMLGSTTGSGGGSKSNDLSGLLLTNLDTINLSLPLTPSTTAVSIP